MEFSVFTLSNGIRVIHSQISHSAVSHCGFMVNAGSRDEIDAEHGLAHLVEHTIFKGTSKRKAFHILNRLDSVGGEINAYTTKEETSVYASFLNEHFERALELLTDITFHSVFPEKELKKEKEVIIDEINAYQDSPSEQIFDDFEELIYANQPIGRGILGTTDNVRQMNRGTLLNFYKKHYTPSRVVFSSVGSMPVAKLKRLLEKHLGSIVSTKQDYHRVAYSNYQQADKVVKRELYQAHCMIGNVAYSLEDERRRGMVLLNNILGGPGMNSRLNLNVREKYGFAYYLESNYSPYTDTGLFAVYLGTDQKSLSKTKKLVFKELQKLRDTRLGTVQLHNAQQQLIGQIALAQESRSNVMLSLGKSLMNFGKVDTLQEVQEQIENITASDLLEVANQVFDANQLSSLTYLPNNQTD